MSTYIEGASVHLDDVNGHPATIPTNVLHLVTRYAINNDDGVVAFGLHVFGRDALIGARDLLDSQPRCTYSDRWFTCEQRAVFDLANPRDRCEAHPKETHR
jgi:hypothetical protein